MNKPNEQGRLFSYLMTHDSGFAPNPFLDVLTLATCKPGIRKTKKPGDWVAGFASGALVNNSKENGVNIPYQGLIYLMKISEVMVLGNYFTDPRFNLKKPIIGSLDLIKQSGDNIYEFNCNGGYTQLPNDHHDSNAITRDTGGANVLIADEFYYFGRNSIVPKQSWQSVDIRVPKGPTYYGYKNDAQNLKKMLSFLQKSGYAPGVHGTPCLWKIAQQSSCSGK